MTDSYTTPRRRTRRWIGSTIAYVSSLLDLDTGSDHDEVGELRLTVPNLEWEDYVEIAFGALVREAANTPQVLDHIDEALRDLRTIAPRERQQVLAERIGCIERTRAALEAGR